MRNDDISLGAMCEIPDGIKIRTSWENFVAKCPTCGKESIFNRASDLCTFQPIVGLNVRCLSESCAKPFRISDDRLSTAHETLFWDCYDLRDHKQYMMCILNQATAYEAFFSLFFRVELLYKPFCADGEQTLDDLNRLSRDLYKKLEGHAFSRMRALFLQHVVTKKSPKDLAEAAQMISCFSPCPKAPKDADIGRLADGKLARLLQRVKATKIHELRNRVAHRAYRPTRVEVGATLKETREILLPLTSCLNLCEDVNWYKGRK